MTIAKRLILLLAVPLVALFGLGLFARWQLAKIEERGQFVARSRVDALATLGNLSRRFAELGVDLRNHLLANDDATRQAARRQFDASEAELLRLQQDYANRLVFSEQGHRLMNEFRMLGQEWIEESRRIMAAAERGRHDEAVALLAERNARRGERLNVILHEWIANNQEQAASAGAEALTAIETFRTNMSLAIAAAALLTAALGYATFRRI